MKYFICFSFIVGGIFFVIKAIQIFYLNKIFLRKCFCTKGKIIALEIVKGVYDTIESYMIIKIEYKDNHNITYTKNYEVGILDVKIGDYLDIYYEIENPNSYKVNIEEYGSFYVTIIFGIVLFLVGLLGLFLPIKT